MSSLYRLITKTNLKSPTIVFPLIMPFIFLLFYSVMVPEPTMEHPEAAQAFVNSILITTLSITTMQSGLMGFGFNFMNLKKSVMIRRIGATKMNKYEVLGAAVLYGMTIWVISFVWILSLSAIFSASGLYWYAGADGAKNIVHIDWAAFNWGRLALATIIGVYLSYGMGAFFVSIAKDTTAFQGIAMMYFFAASILGGMMIPGAKPDWMNTIAFFIPHAYFADMFAWATESGGTFASLQETTRIAIDVLIPILVGTAAYIAGAKLLKFD